MPPKSIFRQSGTQHFQVVHRSQRDPLIHDPEASQHVLKAFDRRNAAKSKSRADLENSLSTFDLAHDKERANIGEAALYGVYFDDTDYDYLQHLRPAGLREDGVNSILIEAPVKAKGKGKAKDSIELLGLPPDALPSATEVVRSFETQESVPSSIAGFQPDLDPHLRQALEALEDEAFVDDDLDDDFFGELVGEGELAVGAHLEFEFREEGIEGEELISEDPERYGVEGGEGEESWEARFAKFKIAQKAAPPSDTSESDNYSEEGDTIGTLPQFSVIGGKKRRRRPSDASGYSMSSSSMFRNEGLSVLDERFEEIQQQYDSDEVPDKGSDDSDEAPELITTREDFDAMMNEFLDNFEIIGGKMRRVLSGETATDKLDTIRKALGEARLRDGNNDEENSEADNILMPLDVDEKQERWDCETILTTYSNLENHPRLIKVREGKRVTKIRLDRKTGLPVVNERQPQLRAAPDSTSETESDDSGSQHTTISRPKNESKEDKKARKQAVKAERQQRRVAKKATKEQFSSEARRQNKTMACKEKNKGRKL